MRLSWTSCCLRSPVGNTSSTRAGIQNEGQEVLGGNEQKWVVSDDVDTVKFLIGACSPG